MIRVFDTLSGELKDLPKSPNGNVRMFVCGPTVNDYSHLGHARTYIVFDAFVRYLAHRGERVSYLVNVTDVDDKIITRGRNEKRSPQEVAKFFTNAYLEDMRRLNINSVEHYAPASKFISAIVKQVEALIAKGHAYTIPNDGIYFDITTFDGYGKLSHRTAAQAEDGVSRIDESIAKRNRGDFALWKFPETPVRAPFFMRKKTVNGEPLWKTRIGWGRPGWHIEDTSITESFFGTHYEIHGGGSDLKFPHHEAEIAQQESVSGKPLVDAWMHIGFLTIRGAKMSKSKGNFITIRDILKDYPPEVLRWMVLMNHYRSPVDYTPELMGQVEAQVQRISTFLSRLIFVSQQKKNASANNPAVPTDTKSLHEAFYKAADEDFNTSLAFVAVFEFLNTYQDRIFGLSTSDALLIHKTLTELLGSLGIQFGTREIPRHIKEIGAQRELYRANKQFAQSDDLRKELERLGYKVSDTPYGALIEWQKQKTTI